MVRTIILLIFSAQLLIANDGSYLSRGGVLKPMQETRVILQKEILSFTCNGDKSTTNVYFEFNNPENETITNLVGFVVPLPTGDVSEWDWKNKGVDNFKIQHEGVLLPYKLKMADNPDGQLYDTSDFKFSQWGNTVYVYLFEVKFHPGINRIIHSYNSFASSSVSFNRQFDYVLTTGSKWSGSAIKDLTIEICFQKDSYFYVNDVFGNSANWNVVGTGKVTGKTIKWGETEGRMVRVQSGKLIIQTNNLIPKQNIAFGILNTSSFCHYGLDYEDPRSKIKYAICQRKLSEKEEYSKKELRLIRNGIYAEYGYSFKSQDLTEYFNTYAWYLPDPNLRINDIVLKEGDNEFIKRIIELENQQ